MSLLGSKQVWIRSHLVVGKELSAAVAVSVDLLGHCRGGDDFIGLGLSVATVAKLSGLGILVI